MKKLLLAGAAILLSVSSASALPTSFSVGGLSFSNITCSVQIIGTALGSCDALGLATAPGGNGIRISGSLDSLSGSASSIDVLVGYQLASTSPLASVGLDFNGLTIGNGLANAQVVETAFTSPGGTILGQTSVYTPSPLASTLILPTPETSLYLVKDILLTSFPGTSSLTEASISFIDQTFPIGGGGGGGGTPVPEPTAMALLGVGLLGIGLARRKRA